MVNFPSGSYNLEADAMLDNDATAIYTIPAAFTGTGFLMARLTVKHAVSGNTYSISQNESLLGLLPSVAPGASAGTTLWGDIDGTLSNQTDLQAELDAKSDTGHTHVEADITDLQTYLLPADIGVTVQAWSAILDGTTASFTAAEETKLAGIETAADVTDTTNVTAAGALMDSEVDADIKTLVLPASTTISAFAQTFLDDLSAAAVRATLGVDPAGTDNSTDVTLAGTPDYLTLAGQVLTRNQIDLAADVSGNLPVGNLNSGTDADANHVWHGDASWKKVGSILVHASGDATRTTSATSETTMEQVTIPGGLMGPNGFIEVRAFFKVDAAPTNNYRFVLKIEDTTSGNEFLAYLAKAVHGTAIRWLYNQNNAAVQAGANKFGWNPWVVSSGAPTAYSTDTDSDFDIFFRFKFDAADSARTMTLLHTSIRVHPGD
jgi:hypothetical protein